MEVRYFKGAVGNPFIYVDGWILQLYGMTSNAKNEHKAAETVARTIKRAIRDAKNNKPKDISMDRQVGKGSGGH